MQTCITFSTWSSSKNELNKPSLNNTLKISKRSNFGRVGKSTHKKKCIMATASAPVQESEALHTQTPLILSNPMSEHLGKPVYLKMDALQPTGSFKLRGIGLTCQRALGRGVSRLVSSSGGNAGLAVAHAGRELNMDTTVVVPESTPEFIRERLKGYGAEVVVHGSQWAVANERAIQIAEESNGVLVHPFEGEDTWEGHGSLVSEVAAASPFSSQPPGAIIASVGGGGLALGILSGLQSVGWLGRVGLVACETEGADCLAQALAKGDLVTLPAITSIAKSLGANQVSPGLLSKAQDPDNLVSSWVCSDEAAVKACLTFANQHRVLVEPACGAALAAVYERAPVLEQYPSVLVEVCGGSIVDLDLLQQWSKP